MGYLYTVHGLAEPEVHDDSNIQYAWCMCPWLSAGRPYMTQGSRGAPSAKAQLWELLSAYCQPKSVVLSLCCCQRQWMVWCR
jgi:hypothetical protein